MALLLGAAKTAPKSNPSPASMFRFQRARGRNCCYLGTIF
jgi:hypothetical protein